jgi:outer membrane cobalamin receptor
MRFPRPRPACHRAARLEAGGELGANDAEGHIMLVSPRSTRRVRSLSILVSALVLAVPVAYGRPADVVDDRPARMSGTVVDPDGARVPGAKLVLVIAGSGAVSAEATADGTGEFRFDQLAPGHYELRATAEGFRAVPQAVLVAADEERRVRVELHVSAVTESVVVSAAQVELPAARAADSVTVVTSRDLRASQVETVADALRSVPGLTVSRNGGRGSVTSLFPRGGESDFTLVLVDGMKTNAFGGGYDFSAMPAADVERVEVVRGPQSALFGADAMGAVVQVVTRHGGSPRAEGTMEGGTFGTSRVTAGTWGSRGRWSWGATGERAASDGFTGIASATGEQVSNDDSLAATGSFTAGWRSRGGADIRASARVTSLERGFPGPFGSNPIGAYTEVDRLSRGTTATNQFGARWTKPFSAGGRQLRQTVSGSYLDLESDFASAYGLSASATRRTDLRTQTDVTMSNTVGVSAGVEVQREEATSTFITANSAGPVPIRRWVAGLFAEARYQPAAPLTFTAGVRGEWIQRDALGQNPDPFSPRPAFGTESQTSVNPRVSAAFLLGGSRRGGLGWTRLHASAGTGIRPPDALEIAFTDNPSLRPERSRSVEAGVDQAAFGERLLLGATAFFNRYDDLIVAVGPAIANASMYRTDNISNASANGVELSASGRTGWGLGARVSYTFLDTEILAVDRVGSAAPAPFTVGDPLLRRPRHSASLDLTYARGHVTAFARAGSRSRALDVEPSWGTYGGLFYNPGFTVVDAGASWRIVPAIELIGRVGNLFARQYEETYGFPALGRNFTIGVRVAAGR